MKTAPISSILIKPNRQRSEFDPQKMQELEDSIRDLGLMHAPVLRWEGAQRVLVAGERRFRAIKNIFALGDHFSYDGNVYSAKNGMIPYTDLGDLGELEAEEAELDENLKRSDLTWQEHAAAVERLHNLRRAQAEKSFEAAVDSGAIEKLSPAQILKDFPSHSVADTALELLGRSDGDYQGKIRRELIVARHLDNPVIAKAKSADEAFKILKREEERDANIKLGHEVGKTFNADKHELHNINCLEYMKGIAANPNAELFDVILTDPPYGMGADDFGDAAGKLSGIQHHYDDSLESWQSLMQEWTLLSYLIAKPQAHAYVFCDIDNFHALKALMQKAGWYVFRTPFTVFKQNSGRVPLPDRGPRRQSEWILYAIKGNKPVTHIYPDVISVSGDDNLGHGAQKPVALAQNLLTRSVRAGDRIFDGFVGTGFVFPAAHTLKCIAVGCELDTGNYGIALGRLRSLKNLETPSLI